jgi:hypothetical protein
VSSFPGFVTKASSSEYSVGVRRSASPALRTRERSRSTSSSPNRSTGDAGAGGVTRRRVARTRASSSSIANGLFT